MYTTDYRDPVCLPVKLRESDYITFVNNAGHTIVILMS